MVFFPICPSVFRLDKATFKTTARVWLCVRCAHESVCGRGALGISPESLQWLIETD